MENETNLPFKVGGMAEAKTFEEGFRGAWFRCKIREISKRKGRLGYVSEYYDFPDEKLEWTRFYQVPGSNGRKAKDRREELMLRPQYPHIHNESQIPDISEISEVTVIVDGTWKVGDLVDWWTTDCYWSGRITQLLGDDKAKIELKPPPLGEGQSYTVSLKDLRPSLDWSLKHGWTIPTQEGHTGCPCARLIKPINQVIGRNPIEHGHNAAGQETDAVWGSAGSPARLSSTISSMSNSAVSDEARSTRTREMCKPSLGKAASKKLKDEKEKGKNQRRGDSSTGKTTWADTDSGKISAETVAEEDVESNRSQKKYKVPLHSSRSDTLEATILDLEEYVNKIKWLKKVLKYGISPSDEQSSQWQFVEPHVASEIPK